MNIPRKLHIDDAKDNPTLWAVTQGIDVFLDGERQTGCLSYDLDTGEIERFATDATGKIIIEGKEIKRETVRGKIEVREKQSEER